MATTRGRIVFVALTLFIVYFLFIATPTSQSEREYRQRTEDGLARRRSKLQGDLSDQEWTRQTNEKLRAILENHPHGSRGGRNEEVRSAYDPIVTGDEDKEGSGVAGSGKKYHHSGSNQHGDHSKPRYPKPEDTEDSEEEDDDTVVQGDTGVGGSRDRFQKGMGRTSTSNTKEKQVGDPGKDLAREQLHSYLKQPIVIFSKSYCPHSRQAKKLLTQIYTITPTPLIIELDQLNDPVPPPEHDSSESHDHQVTLGRKIQDLLGEITGRNTVPNIMVGMNSIGGNDLLWEMHEAGSLQSTIQKLAGKRVSIELNEDYHDHDHT